MKKKIVAEKTRMKIVKAQETAVEKFRERERQVVATVNELKKSIKKENDDKDLSGRVKQQKKRNSLDSRLQSAITEYNEAYSAISDHGMKLYNLRERSVDLLAYIENLVNSIANHPKSFDSEIEMIQISRSEFKKSCEYAAEELNEAKKSATGIGAGIASGAAVAFIAPSAAMWIATTFGTASTGTAISALSGAAATNAALAWLGGGAIAAGGGGMAAGNALLALAGPIGWSIAGATLLTSIILFANKKRKLDKEKRDEIESVQRNAFKLKEADAKLSVLLVKTDEVRAGLNEQYSKALALFGRDFMDIPDEEKIMLGIIVNNAKALAASLSESV